jgi:hypothetical protein
MTMDIKFARHRTVEIVRGRENASHRHTDTGIPTYGHDDGDHPEGVLVGGGAVHDTDVEHLQHTGGIPVRRYRRGIRRQAGDVGNGGREERGGDDRRWRRAGRRRGEAVPGGLLRVEKRIGVLGASLKLLCPDCRQYRCSRFWQYLFIGSLVCASQIKVSWLK